MVISHNATVTKTHWILTTSPSLQIWPHVISICTLKGHFKLHVMTFLTTEQETLLIDKRLVNSANEASSRSAHRGGCHCGATGFLGSEKMVPVWHSSQSGGQGIMLSKLSTKAFILGGGRSLYMDKQHYGQCRTVGLQRFRTVIVTFFMLPPLSGCWEGSPCPSCSSRTSSDS